MGSIKESIMLMMIKEANILYREGKLELALQKYYQIKKFFPELSEYIEINIKKTKSKMCYTMPENRYQNINSKLNIFLLGRTETYLKGGIHKSCKLISSCMANIGHNIIEHDTSRDLPAHLDDIDICIIYTGDPERPDFKTVDAKIKKLQSLGIPILINLSYNKKKMRTQYICQKILEYNSDSYVPVFAFFFTESSALDPDLYPIRKYTCVIPKTLLFDEEYKPVKFEEREGICIGDAAKFQNQELFGDSPQVWIDAIKKLSPEISIYTYKQYSDEYNLKKVTYIPYMKQNFLNFIGKRRLFVSLPQHCTFEMVPCEAQFCGVPVIYRHMPQSLSEYISISGIAVRSPDEAAHIIKWLYYDKNAWENMSQSSIFRAKSNSIKLIASSMEGYIRLALFRSHCIQKTS